MPHDDRWLAAFARGAAGKSPGKPRGKSKGDAAAHPGGDASGDRWVTIHGRAVHIVDGKIPAGTFPDHHGGDKKSSAHPGHGLESHHTGIDPDNQAHRQAKDDQSRRNHEHASLAVKGTDRTPEKHLDEVTRGFSDAVKSGHHYVRIPSSSVPHLLESGRFKSQFETKNSRGRYEEGHHERREAEEKAFGLPQHVDDASRPIYGYVSARDFGHATTHHEVGLHQYGDAVVRLKDHVRDRSTVTIGDSLTGGAVGSPAYSPDHHGIRQADLADVHKVATDHTLDAHGKLARIQEHVPYIEAQHFGGVHAHDIAEVGFPSEPHPHVAESLARHGIPYRVLGDTTSDAAFERRGRVLQERREKERAEAAKKFGGSSLKEWGKKKAALLPDKA